MPGCSTPLGSAVFEDGRRLWSRLVRWRRRLCDCNDRLQTLTEGQARTVVADCNDYFSRNPYGWFNPLQALLNTAVGARYSDRSACHLDPVQWATHPVRGRLTDRAAAAALLLEEGLPYLETLLTRSNVHPVLLNDATVVEQLQHVGLARLREVKRIPRGNISCRLLVGEGTGSTLLAGRPTCKPASACRTSSSSGWRGRSGTWWRLCFPQRRRRWRLWSATPTQVEAPMRASDLEIDADGFLPRGVKVSGKREFADLLRRWHDESRAKTIGDVGSYGGTACITVDLGGDDVVLNVDTKRSAVTTYLDHVRRLGPDLPWRVVANNRGTVNKIIFSDDPAEAAGWYHYLRRALAQPGQL